MKRILAITVIAILFHVGVSAQVTDSLRVTAISTVSGEKLTKTTSASLGNSLQGNLAGLTFLAQSGQPGEDFALSNLYLRGRNSYISGQKMLVYIDGFEADINSVIAEEVESISLLKDAAALAIYGARGANGVIQIKTKRGTEGSTKVRFNIQSGVQTPLRSPGTVNAYDYAVLYNQACINDGLDPFYADKELSAYKDGSEPFRYPNVNWKSEMMRPLAPLTHASMSFRGGNQIVRYYVLLGAMNNQGFFKGTDSKKNENANADYTTVNIRSNIDVQITKHLSALFNFGGQIGMRSFAGASTSASTLLGNIYSTAPNAFPVKYENGRIGGNSAQTNPVGELLYRGLNKENRRNLQIIFSPKLDMDFVTKGLSLNATVAYSNYMSETSGKSRNYARYDVEGNVFGVDEPLTAFESFKTDWGRTDIKGSVDYSRIFGNHSVDASIFGLFDSYREYAERSIARYVSFGAIATYSFAKRYIAQFSITTTGCDNYARGHRYGLFPAVSLGWVISEEQFLKGNKGIDYLKLRASAGRCGNNQGAGRYLYSGVYATTGSYLLGTGSSASTAYGATSITNESLTWETQEGINVGLDARLFKGLDVNLDVFWQQRRDIVDQVATLTPGFVGTTYGDILPYTNAGKVASGGFELTLLWHKRMNKDFEWNLGAGTWYARNIVKEMGEAVRAYDYQYRRGHIVGQPYVLVADGLYQQNDFNTDGTLKESLPIPQYGDVHPGDIKYVDKNNDGVINVNDGYPVGHTTIPEWNFTLEGGFNWRGLELSLQFNAFAGRDIYLNGTSVYSLQGNSSASVLAKDSWTPENTNASYPRLSTKDFNHNYRTSTFWRRNGSFLRLKNLYLAYRIPLKSSSREMSVYFNATNLFSIDGMKGFTDPEPSSMVTYPLARTFSLGINYTL